MLNQKAVSVTDGYKSTNRAYCVSQKERAGLDLICLLRWAVRVRKYFKSISFEDVPAQFNIKVAMLPNLSLGVILFLMNWICCIKHKYQTMDLGLPFHSCTFDDITMTSSGFRGNLFFFFFFG